MSGLEPSPVGFVCELSPAARVEQAEKWSRQRRFVVSYGQGPDGLRATFESCSREELVSLVAVERECCAWATWSLSESAEGVVLEVSGPAAELTALSNALGF